MENKMFSRNFSRRNLGSAAALIGAAGAALPSVSAKSEITQLPDDPIAQLDAMVKMMGTRSEERVVWKTKGKIFAILPDDVILLYGMRGSESTWWQQVDATTYVRYNSTMSFFTDPETDEIIDEFTSPINGVKIKLPVSYIRHKEGEWFTPLGTYYGSMKKAFPKQYADKPLKLDWTLDNGIIRRQDGDNFPPIIPQPSMEYVSFFSFASEIFDPSIDRASSVSAGWNIMAGGRTPYKELGVPPGNVNWHFDAVKVNSVEDLDPDYLSKARQHSDRFDTSPEFDEGPSFFERILKMRGFS
ncbi:MAG: hypothetical protein CMM25_03225 [Rhodospirillaceae bacterium]|nr:hypothetical protein [Rhodospirillaceae bacterium]